MAEQPVKSIVFRLAQEWNAQLPTSVSVDGNLMDSRPDSRKASACISVSPSGSVILLRLLHLCNACSLIDFTPSGMLMEDKLLQSAKVHHKMSVMCEGKCIEERLTQLPKAAPPISVILSGKCTSDKLSHNWNAQYPIEFTPSEIVIEVKLSLSWKARDPMLFTANSIPLSFCTVAGIVTAPLMSSGLALTSTSHGEAFVTINVKFVVRSSLGTGASNVQPVCARILSAYSLQPSAAL